MGILKQRKEAKRLRSRAEADPAIRDAWVKSHDLIFVGFQVAGVGPNAWRTDTWVEHLSSSSMVPDPTRQELEWWSAMCRLRLSSTGCPGGWKVALEAMIEAVDHLLPDAPDGPGEESYSC